jgi:spore coat polysaccharide biosynthesis protein SpsF
VTIAAIIQARMGSTRLPGKVLRPLCGKTILAHVIDRVRASQTIDEIVVATTDRPADDAIAALVPAFGATLFRGSEEDVLSRLYFAGRAAKADTIVRITADCPLFDGTLLRAMIEAFTSQRRRGERIDYLSNTINRTYPRGLDAEIIDIAALERAHREAKQPPEREHVTPYIYGHPEWFALRSYTATPDLSQLRWTLDTEEDWHLIEAIYAALYRADRLFGTQDILDLIARQPELVALNAHIVQKAVAHA